MGRPSKYKPDFVEQAQKLCRLGATDVEIADFFGVEVRTLYRWKGEHEDFCQALKAGKDVSDERVERSLFARATGYEHEEVDIRVVAGGIVQTPIRKHYPPDTTACIFWLKNRRPDLWRDKTEQEHSGNVGVTPLERDIEALNKLPKAQREALLRQMREAGVATTQ
jgi:hypothetical protein